MACWGAINQIPLYIYKFYSYLEIPSGNDSDGYVYLVVDKSESEVKAMENSLTVNLQQLIDATKVRHVKIEAINSHESKQTELQFYVTDPQISRVPATKLEEFFSRKQVQKNLCIFSLVLYYFVQSLSTVRCIAIALPQCNIY